MPKNPDRNDRARAQHREQEARARREVLVTLEPARRDLMKAAIAEQRVQAAGVRSAEQKLADARERSRLANNAVAQMMAMSIGRSVPEARYDPATGEIFLLPIAEPAPGSDLEAIFRGPVPGQVQTHERTQEEIDRDAEEAGASVRDL